ncbi:hypothetical protein [Pseudoxanthomonas sp. 10H]|uniref:hypothetical protein n=1 Tax=Pseudoxanthomonas sp. 10H TaxID=3242729 RepID=UPI003556AAE1
MLPFILALAASHAPPPEQPAGVAVPALSCDARYFQRLVNAYGAPHAWRENAQAGAAVADPPGELLNDTGVVADGFRHTLVVDKANDRQGYIVQVGGFAGMRRVFGPFPLRGCATAAGATGSG